MTVDGKRTAGMTSRKPAEVLAPDFYAYSWLPPSSAYVEGEFAVIEWADGVVLRAHAWWLRENLVDERGIDAVTREGTLDPADFDPDLSLTSVSIDSDGALVCCWQPQTKQGRLHPGWLRHVAEQRHAVRFGLPEPKVWRAPDMQQLPTLSGPSVLSEDEALREWLESLVCWGVARLVDLPAGEQTIESLAARIGPVRDSNFGLFWSVKIEPEPNTTASTRWRLGPHTDLPTRELPPGFQLLHCLENSCVGGANLLTDGQALADHLAEHEPDVYDALTSLHWIFFNRSRDDDHRWSGPVIDLGAPSSPMSIRGFYPLRAFPDMPEEDIPRAYRSLRRFHQLATDSRFQIRYRLRAGDLVTFDNRRILHGREAFEATGRRNLRGCYIDQDEVHSRLRVLTRRMQSAPTRRA